MLLCMLAFAPHAYADWTVVRANLPVTTIHASTVYQAAAGERLAVDDMVETPANGAVQLQDESGNILALGDNTRVLLARDARIAVLRGWLKVQHACATTNCATPIVETERLRFSLADRTALVIAADVPGYTAADAMFCESGSAQLAPIFSRPDASNARKALPARPIAAHQFARFGRVAPNDTNAALTISKGPDAAFVAAMPVTFRDALRSVPMPARPVQSTNLPAHNARAVTYDDVSDWLRSTLAVRNDPPTRFTARFGPRLSDPAFRRSVRQHLRELPDWRPLLQPRPRPAPHVSIPAPSPANSSLWVRP